MVGPQGECPVLREMQETLLKGWESEREREMYQKQEIKGRDQLYMLWAVRKLSGFWAGIWKGQTSLFKRPSDRE